MQSSLLFIIAILVLMVSGDFAKRDINKTVPVVMVHALFN